MTCSLVEPSLVVIFTSLKKPKDLILSDASCIFRILKGSPSTKSNFCLITSSKVVAFPSTSIRSTNNLSDFTKLILILIFRLLSSGKIS